MTGLAGRLPAHMCYVWNKRRAVYGEGAACCDSAGLVSVELWMFDPVCMSAKR